jgi:PilZ domain
MDQKDMDQKRRYPRVPSENAVLVRKIGVEGVEEFAKTKSMGANGCGFLADEPLGEGSYIELLISVTYKVINTRARVVYEIPADGRWEIGVEFVRLDEEDREIVDTLMSRSVTRE